MARQKRLPRILLTRYHWNTPFFVNTILNYCPEDTNFYGALSDRCQTAGIKSSVVNVKSNQDV